MCGIAGFCNMPERWKENINRMNDRMLHRGPDAGGVWASEDKTVVLGHRRLSILDLSPAGAQPMMSASGRFVIVLNGELYNYLTLQKKLSDEKKISAFRGTSDTEVLLEAFEAYGVEAVLKQIKGMFAFALYDRRDQKLFLGRDRIGEKPLYYGFMGSQFVFASDIAVIRRNLYFKEELDREALALYFGHGYIPSPFTIYKNIKKLEAGTILELEYPFTGVKSCKYWDVMEIARRGRENPFRGSEEEAADELERLLKESVKGQMRADVPVGAFLSGGIDSTAVAAVMQSLNTNKIRTFTIGFENADYNEAVYAKETANYLGTEHTQRYISDREAQEVIPKLAGMYGEPFADSSQIPTYLVSELAKRSVTVSLSGDGGDELFCGYPRYNRLERHWKLINRIPRPLRIAAVQAAGGPTGGRWRKLETAKRYFPARSGIQLYELATGFRWMAGQMVKGADFPEYRLTQYPEGFMKELPEDYMLMDLQMYHPDDILVKVDRAGMAVSLESRIPFLDRDLVEFVWTLPLCYKYSDNIEKRVLKKVLFRYVPEQMMERKKKGFSIPVDQWIREGELRPWAESLMNERDIKEQGILDERYVSGLWGNFIRNGRWYPQIWYILMFEEWYRRRLE
ncbi:asparagine synthase (glutamine-hydrolyzing) [Otoolea muris]|uniref:asparagine synthase (glutamine-hydrolyzing) n=1 Tax=Otoolea muris TaxID=2941515 RepID=UPI002040484D|nr:asparagine synthase (glutamine-hydrolyzing) [Otoolea muris]